MVGLLSSYFMFRKKVLSKVLGKAREVETKYNNQSHYNQFIVIILCPRTFEGFLMSNTSDQVNLKNGQSNPN